MTQSIIPSQSNRHYQHNLSCSQLLFSASLMGGASALAAGLFTTISPLGGAIFGVSSLLSHRLVHSICNKVSCSSDSIIFKVAQFALSLIGGIVGGVLVTTTFGFPVTIATGIALTMASTATLIAAFLVSGGCLCSSAIATGIAFGTNEGTATRV
jgi:hypothetical protein